MSLNSSSGFSDSLTHPDVSSGYYISFVMSCISSEPSSILYTTLKCIRIIIIFPLCISILHHGFQQWKQKRSTSSASTLSHSECFTYHMVTMELIVILGYILSFVGIYVDNSNGLYIGILILQFVWYGEMCFHILTCLERYLAVVHPIIYMNLRNDRGIRFRNIIVCFVWLLCLVGMFLVTIKGFDIVFSFFLLILSLTTACFCSISVLCVLIRPGPAKQENGKLVDPSKLRAFHTLMAILAVLLLRFVWDVLWLELCAKGDSRDCIMIVSGFWFTLPCSLVLPLLFLHRAGKLACCKIPSLHKG